MRKDNRGFTLVEILVVLAIMTIGVTTAFVGIRYLNNTNANKAAATIDSTLKQLRVDSMAQSTAYRCEIVRESQATKMKIYKQQFDYSAGKPVVDASGNPSYALSREVELGALIESITLDINGSTSTVSTTLPGGVIHLSFKKSTGGFGDINIGPIVAAASSAGTSYGTLTIKTTSGNTASMKLYLITGKVEIQ